MRRKLVILTLATALICLCTYAYLVQFEQRAVASQLIRLHVVANSDSVEDQARKLAVRDALLPVITELTADCGDRDAAAVSLQAGLARLTQAAENTLLAQGCDDPVGVSLQEEVFPRRDYETFSLPAGSYETLRVTIGAGAGHNWWCVAFPALCLPATGDGFITTAVEAGLSESQIALLSDDSPQVELKFRVLDWISALFG